MATADRPNPASDSFDTIDLAVCGACGRHEPAHWHSDYAACKGGVHAMVDKRAIVERRTYVALDALPAAVPVPSSNEATYYAQGHAAGWNAALSAIASSRNEVSS